MYGTTKKGYLLAQFQEIEHFESSIRRKGHIWRIKYSVIRLRGSSSLFGTNHSIPIGAEQSPLPQDLRFYPLNSMSHIFSAGSVATLRKHSKLPTVYSRGCSYMLERSARHCEADEAWLRRKRSKIGVRTSYMQFIIRQPGGLPWPGGIGHV